MSRFSVVTPIDPENLWLRFDIASDWLGEGLAYRVWNEHSKSEFEELPLLMVICSLRDIIKLYN